MSDRFALIARKQEVQRQIEQARRRLEREQLLLSTANRSPNRRRISQLESQLEQLMAEESSLRLKIDQSK
jgi:hypothetical protein